MFIAQTCLARGNYTTDRQRQTLTPNLSKAERPTLRVRDHVLFGLCTCPRGQSPGPGTPPTLQWENQIVLFRVVSTDTLLSVLAPLQHNRQPKVGLRARLGPETFSPTTGSLAARACCAQPAFACQLCRRRLSVIPPCPLATPSNHIGQNGRCPFMYMKAQTCIPVHECT